MNINKFTQKSIEAVNGCEKIGLEYGNQQIEQEHLLLSLLNIEDSLIEKLLQKMGVDTAAFRRDVTDMVAGLPKVSGAGQMYFSNDANKVLTGAEDEAKAMGDVRYKVGNLLSSDVFYHDVGGALDWQKMGVLAVEMESAALYMEAARAGKNALCICTISDHLVTGEELSSAERQNTFTQMMEIALEIA